MTKLTDNASGTPEPTEHFSTDHLQEDLKGRSVRGGAVTMTAQAAKFILNLGAVMVLARILTPDDFGLVAMVTAVTGFFLLFKDLGLSAATIQRAEVNHEQVTALFWVNVAAGSLIALVTLAAAPAVAWFYKDSRLTVLTMVLAPMFLFGGFAVQHQALLTRQMRYGALAMIEIAALVAGAATGLITAWIGVGYWALAYMPVANALAGAVGVWIACKWRPGLPSRHAGVRSMLGFGGDVTAFSVINYIARTIDKVLIGRFWGDHALGVYERAYKLLLTPLQQFNAPVAAVAVPALSRLADQPDRYRHAYLRILEKLTILAIPAIGFMIVTADWLVLVFLGRQWEEAGRLFAILGVAALATPVTNSTGWLFISQGRSRDMLHWGVARGIIVVTAVCIGLKWGAVGVAIAYTTSLVLLRVPIVLWWVGRRGPVSALDICRTTAPALIAAVCGIGAVHAFRVLCDFTYFTQTSNPFIGLPVGFVIAGITVVFALVIQPSGRAAIRDLVHSSALAMGETPEELIHLLKTPGRPVKRLLRNIQFAWSRRHLRGRRKIIYALTPPPNLQNVGDHAQAIAIRAWLCKHFAELPVIEVDKDESRYYLRALRWLVRPDDIVFIQSGGNLGNAGIWSESLRRMLIVNFPRNKIVSLPQTISFSETPLGREERENTRRIYATHPDLTVVARDSQSEAIANDLFPNAKILCMPDFALSLPPRDRGKANDPPRVLLCFREDAMSTLSGEQEKLIAAGIPYECKQTNTYIDEEIPLAKQEEVFERTLDEFSAADVVVTNRFHGVIFAILCRRPCVVLATTDHKMTASMDWYKSMPWIVRAERLDDIPALVEKCLRIDERDMPDWNAEYFDRLPALLGLTDREED